MKQSIRALMMSVLCFVLTMLTSVITHAEPADGVSAAKQSLEAFMTAWNQADNEALRETLNYPMLTLFGSSFSLANSPEEFTVDFESMREREGWRRSSFDDITVTRSSPEKVHLRVVFSRYGSDGKAYLTAGVFYVVTLKGGRWGVQFRGLGRAPGAVLTDEQTTAEFSAHETVLDFFTAFNASDNAGVRESLNLPHAFLVNGGRLMAAMDDSGPGVVMNFDAMREREGWYMSSLDSLEPVVIAPTVVAYELVFSRYHKNGLRYRSIPALWILTKQDGHWGIQFRSLMRATFTAN
ncbi:MAG: hypothetical protein O7F71_04425 [Gammaproteobacteria bacterium]|nr:hypothetical protein [Gammaproteobacteria bacterium]